MRRSCARPLWQRLKKPAATPGQRLRILAVLATFDTEGTGWTKAAEEAVEPWLSDNPLYLADWTDALRPVRDKLLTPLTRVFLEGPAERRPAVASILADYAKDRPQTLVELIVEADDRTFRTLLPVLARHRDRLTAAATRGDLPGRGIVHRIAVRDAGATAVRGRPCPGMAGPERFLVAAAEAQSQPRSAHPAYPPAWAERFRGRTLAARLENGEGRHRSGGR